ncbi:hypothetical protein [Meridianimarinicoccus sp. RP-17]
MTRSRPHSDPDRSDPRGPAWPPAPLAPRDPPRRMPDDPDAWRPDPAPAPRHDPAPRPDAAPPTFRRGGSPRPEPATAPETIAHDVLGAGWVDGRLSALERAVHPAAWLRAGLAVAAGPGAAMAAALADLGQIGNAAYFAEATLTSATRPDDLCAHALAAMDAGAAAGHGSILSLRGSLTGQMAPQPGTPPAEPVRLRMMADMWCAGGQVLDGWVLRDTAAEARAAGLHPADWARARLRAAGAADRLPPPLTPDTDPDGPYVARSPGGGPNEWGDRLADRLRRIMDGDLAALDRGSDPACDHTLPGAVTGLGSAPARMFWAGLRAALPGAAFRVEHRHGTARPGEAPQAAVRWSLYGRHDGPGRFGPPTGCFLHVLGMTQAEFGPSGVRREWTLIDDCAVWTQIALASIDA